MTISRWRALALCLCLCLLLPCAARGEGARVYTFAYDDIPAALIDSAMTVSAARVEIDLTFTGDCTLGADVGARGGRNAFPSVIKREGYAYPFANLRAVFDTDDLTVVNLEGVLSDSESGRADKTYRFRGDPAYTAILTEGGVECAGLANNHALDYGARGRQATVAALEEAGIAYFDDTVVTVLEKGGVRVGLTGSGFSPKRERFLAQVEALRSVGCAAIIHVMHIGREYADALTASQTTLAKFCAENGACLIVGHHPHVVQGMRTYDGVPAVFSLGNCVFGGNVAPRDYDACLLRARLTFAEGVLTGERLTLLPIRVSGTARRNDFQPVLLSGADAARVLKKMQKTSDAPLAPYAEGEGAAQPEIRFGNEGGTQDGTGTDAGEDAQAGL